jgi:hypothetical protein
VLRRRIGGTKLVEVPGEVDGLPTAGERAHDGDRFRHGLDRFGGCAWWDAKAGQFVPQASCADPQDDAAIREGRQTGGGACQQRSRPDADVGEVDNAAESSGGAQDHAQRGVGVDLVRAVGVVGYRHQVQAGGIGRPGMREQSG